MGAKEPEVAGLRDRLLGQRRDVVGVGQAALVGKRVEELLEVAVVEAEEVEAATWFLRRARSAGSSSFRVTYTPFACGATSSRVLKSSSVSYGIGI